MNLRRATLILKLFVVISFLGLSTGCGGGGGGGGGGGNTNSSIAGTWNITEHGDADTCGDEAYTDTYPMVITVNGSQITVTDPEDTEEDPVTGTISGNKATFNITEEADEDGWSGTTHLVITFSSDGKTFTAQGSWTETNGVESCAGTFTLNGTKNTDTTDKTVNFADYLPLDTSNPFTSTYTYTLVGEGQIIGTIDGTETIHYKTGDLKGVVWTKIFPEKSEDQDLPVGETYIIRNDGTTVQFLGYDNGEDGMYYASTDRYLTAPPTQWAIGNLTDRQTIDQSGEFYFVTPDLSAYTDGSQKIFVRVQDVTVQGITYPKAVVWYSLDLKYPFAALNFKGKDASFGITPPTSSDTGGKSVTDFCIYAKGIGEIVSGDVDAETGEFDYMYELISITHP